MCPGPSARRSRPRPPPGAAPSSPAAPPSPTSSWAAPWQHPHSATTGGSVVQHSASLLLHQKSELDMINDYDYHHIIYQDSNQRQHVFGPLFPLILLLLSDFPHERSGSSPQVVASSQCNNRYPRVPCQCQCSVMSSMNIVTPRVLCRAVVPVESRYCTNHSVALTPDPEALCDVFL